MISCGNSVLERGKEQPPKRLVSRKIDLRQLRNENFEDLSSITIKAMKVLLTINRECEPCPNALEKLRCIKNWCTGDEFFMDHQETRNHKWPGELFEYIRPLDDTSAVSLKYLALKKEIDKKCRKFAKNHLKLTIDP